MYSLILYYRDSRDNRDEIATIATGSWEWILDKYILLHQGLGRMAIIRA